LRYLRYLLLAIIALIVVALSVANRGPVDVTAWPDLTAYGAPLAPVFSIPLYIVALGCGAIGFIIGAAREYLREARFRRRAAEARREVAMLQGEVKSLKRSQQLDEDDEIIALTSR
jgi:uncharacterized integral membrane protein